MRRVSAHAVPLGPAVLRASAVLRSVHEARRPERWCVHCGPAAPHQGGRFGSVCLGSISPTQFSPVRVPISIFLDPGVFHFS